MRDGDGNRHAPLVRDRDAHLFEVHGLGPTRGAAMEVDLRRTGPVRQDRDVAPSDAAHAEAEHLADGLLGRPATRDPLDPASAVALLVFGQDAKPKAVREAGQDGMDAVDVDEVDPDLMAA